MPKLNYTNRKSEGPKLGAIVRKDLGKRIKPGSAHKDSSAIELHLEGKTLTDDGVAEVAAGLVEMFKFPNSTERLHVLNLAGNALTIASLRSLAPAIAAAAPELQDLDLSANNIAVATAHDTSSWASFLAALSECRHLKRLNLSHNQLSLSPTWDVFLRIYLQQFKQNSDLWQGSTNDEEDVLQDGDSEDGENEAEVAEAVAQLHIGAKGADMNRTRASGLPSIMQIDLSDNEMTDAGCLFLSYLIERHRFIQDKILHIVGSGVAGAITWQPNDKLGPVGTKMLKYAESTAWHPSKDKTRHIEARYGLHRLSEPSPDARTSAPIALATRTRRSSQASTETHAVAKSSSHYRDSTASELESLRRKVQRGIIEDHGLHTVELWTNALGLLALVRQNLVPLQSGMIEKLLQGSVSLEENCNVPVPSPLEGWTSIPAPPASRCQLPKMGVQGPTINMQAFPPPGWTAPHFTMEEWPELALRKSSADSAVHTLHKATRKVSIEDKCSQEGRLAGLQPPTKTAKGRLPCNVLEKIFCFMADPDHVLSEAQRRNVIAWGRSRATLAVEQEALGKPRSVQIWRVLEAIDCLAYDEDA